LTARLHHGVVLRALVATPLALLSGLVAGCGGASARDEVAVRARVSTEAEAVAVALSVRPDDCSADALAQIPARAWAATPSGPWLVHVVCELGAYQPSGSLVRVDASGDTSSVALPLLGEDGAATSTTGVGDVEVELATRTLVESVRYRGLGDCGRRVTTRLEPDGTLTLLEHREQACSDDEGAEHVTDRARWPRRGP
jgi:hypothetical protein